MSTQLTISIELITFIEWVLKHKQCELATFINNVIDSQLQNKLIAINSNKKTVLNHAHLYKALNGFVAKMEDNINQRIASDAYSNGLLHEKAAPIKRRRHASCCAKKMKLNEAESIKSPIQKVLYQALSQEENNSESNTN